MRPPAHNRRTSAAGGNRTVPRTLAAATGRGQAGLYKRWTSADEDLIAWHEAQLRRRSGRQLDHAPGSPNEPHHPIPGMKPWEDLLHPFFFVQEHGVDGKSHEQHVHAADLARADPHPASGVQRSAKHEADAAADERERDFELVRHDLARSLMHRTNTSHLDSVPY